MLSESPCASAVLRFKLMNKKVAMLKAGNTGEAKEKAGLVFPFEICASQFS